MNSQSPEPPISDKDRKILLKQFRAYLHLAITAGQIAHEKQLKALPGPNMVSYCMELAKLPGNTLAGELAKPVWAVLKQIEEAAMYFHRPLFQKKITDPAKQAEYERILEQLDFALALILRQLPHLARFRARYTKCSDLMCDVIGGMTHGSDAPQLIRRWQKEFDENARDEDGSVAAESFPDAFAWETYLCVEALDKLADEFPEHVKTAARHMHGWPMLVHRHTNNRRRFEQLAKRLELGREYPLDATEGARFRPDTPMVRYLDPLICKINYVRNVMQNANYQSAEEEKESLRSWWFEGMDERPGDDLVEALRVVPQLPPLNKSTVPQWVEKAVIPIIMLTDARDWKSCEQPALQKIAKQASVKSRATFKSRLLAAVTSTLRRLARPA
jgi:hypothetical protein